MDKQIKSVYLISLAAILILSVITGIFSVLAYTFEFDASISHFQFDSVFAPVFIVCSVLSAAAALVLTAVLRRRFTLDASVPMRAGLTFTCAFSGAMLLIVSILGLVEISGGTGASTLLLLRHITGVPAGLCFLWGALADAKKTHASTGFALASFLPILWAIFSVMYYYFDSSYSLNSPLKISLMLMFVSIMLFFSHDCRLTLDRPKMDLFLFSGFCVLIFAGSVAFAGFASFLRGGVSLRFTLPETCLYFAVWLYTLAKLATAYAVLGAPKKTAKEITEEESAGSHRENPLT